MPASSLVCRHLAVVATLPDVVALAAPHLFMSFSTCERAMVTVTPSYNYFAVQWGSKGEALAYCLDYSKYSESV